MTEQTDFRAEMANIEDRIARQQMSAAQVFTQMRQIVNRALSHAEGEAEPVAYRYRVKGQEWEVFDESPCLDGHGPNEEVEPLYTHPAPQVAVPEGYVLAPVEPTRDMMEAAKYEDGDHSEFDEWLYFYGGEARNLYKAMLDAAPTAPQVAEGHIPVPRALVERWANVDAFQAPKGAAMELKTIAQQMLVTFDAKALKAAPTPTKGEEIHVNVDGGSVYTLPLEPTGMAAPRFVVHVPAPTAPDGEQHPDDAAVDRFAAAMKAKLAKKRAEGRSGWDDKERCSQEFLSRLLRNHVGKGDPVDVANLAMMLHQRGEVIQQPVSGPDGRLTVKRALDAVWEEFEFEFDPVFLEAMEGAGLIEQADGFLLSMKVAFEDALAQAAKSTPDEREIAARVIDAMVDHCEHVQYGNCPRAIEVDTILEYAHSIRAGKEGKPTC